MRKENTSFTSFGELKMNEVFEREPAKHVHKQRDWFKVRKYVVERIRKGNTQSRAAYLIRVPVAFATKRRNRWNDARCRDVVRTLSMRPRTIMGEKRRFAESIADLRTKYTFLGTQKIMTMLDIDLNHQKVREVLVENGLVRQGPRKRRVWRASSASI